MITPPPSTWLSALLAFASHPSSIGTGPSASVSSAAVSQSFGIAKPGVFELRGANVLSSMKASEGLEYLIPMPLDYREQTPLTYALTVHPRDSVSSFEIKEDSPGNWVACIRLGKIESGQEIQIEWTSMVLVGERDRSDLPGKAKRPSRWPEETRPWLAATSIVQSGHERFRAIASELREDTDDVLEIMELALEKSREIRESQDGRCSGLDALEALEKEGSCTSAANLYAALLRSAEIPARIVAGYATWYGPHQTHYIVEAWVPGYGWYAVESTLFRLGWAPHHQVQVAIVPASYENKSERRFFAAGGVPYLSLNEMPDSRGAFRNLGTIDRSKNCDHVAALAQALTGSSRDWGKLHKEAKQSWREWLEESPQMDSEGRVQTALQAEDLGPTTAKKLLRAIK